MLSQRTSVDVLYESGAVEKLPVTWNTSSYKSSYLNTDYIFDEDKEAWVSYNEAAGEKPEERAPRIYLFNGKVNLPDRVSNPNNISTDITLEIFVDGFERVEEPYAYPPEGVFYGSQEIHLFCDDPDAEIYYYVASQDMLKSPVKYTGPITLKLEEGATEEQKFLVAFYSTNSNSNKAISHFVINYYTVRPIDPDNQVAEDGTFNYSIAKTFTFSKDIAVCWRVNSADIKLEENSAAYENLTSADLILFTFNVDSADTVPAKESALAVMSIATITPAGNYSIPVQFSTDNGKTWTDEKIITFKTSELIAGNQDNNVEGPNGSGGGCNSGVLGVMTLAAVIAAFFRKPGEK